MKLTFCFQLFLAYFCISLVKCQDLAYKVTPYLLDVNSGLLVLDLNNITETPDIFTLYFDLSRVVISNCPDTCETGEVKQIYRLEYQSVNKTIPSYGNYSEFGESFFIGELDQEALARHDVIGQGDVYIRVQEGFIDNVYLLPSGWERVPFYTPYDFYTYVYNSSTSCTEENRLLFTMEWITYSMIQPSAYDVGLTVYGLVLLADGSPFYGNVTFNWTTQGVVLGKYLDFGDTTFIENQLYYDVWVFPLPLRDGSFSSYDGDIFYLLDPSFLGSPEVEFGDGLIVVNIPFLPGFGLCSPVILDNLYCTNLEEPNECIYRDYSMTTELTFTNTSTNNYTNNYNNYNNYNNNYNNNSAYYYDYYYTESYTTVLTVRYEESIHKLVGIGIFPLYGADASGTTLVLNNFQTSLFYAGFEYIGHYAVTYYDGSLANYTYTHLITTTEITGHPVTARPFCTNGIYTDHNLIRIPVSEIDFGTHCVEDGYLTISAVGNVSDSTPQIVTRSFLISELGDYLIAPLLQYAYNAWVQYSEFTEGAYYDYGFQSHREVINLTIGQYCPSLKTYTVFNTSINLPFIAPSSDGAVVTGEGNEEAVVIVLKGHGFCFDQRDSFLYQGLTNPNDTENVLVLTADSLLTDSTDIITGECVYEGSFDGDILYTCYNFSDALLSPVYTGRLTISDETLLEEVVFDNFEVKLIFADTSTPTFTFPYGPEYGDSEVPRGSNLCGNEIPLTMNIPVGQSIQQSVYVGSNGVISFGMCAAGIFPTEFSDASLEVPVLAPFWTYHDHREFGDVYYRYIESGYELANVSEIVKLEGDESASSFEASWAVIVTWVNVPPYPADRVTFIKCAQLGASYSPACGNTNSYQVVLTTDGKSSYFITEYQCEFMKWSGNIINAVIGFSVPEHYGTHQFSGQTGVSNIGCFDTEENAIVKNTLLYKISRDDFVDFLHEQALKCSEYLIQDLLEYGPISTGIDVNFPCPCSRLQARLDRTFVTISDSSGVDNCYTNRAGVPVRCCYSIFTAALDTDLSVYTRYSPRSESVRYYANDPIEFAVSCSYDEYLTSSYYTVRRRNTCSGYRPPRFLCIYGDPHFITMDDFEYTFNGVGEYVLVQSRAVVGTPTPFTLLGRTGTFVGAPGATILTGLAFRYDNYITVEVLLELTATFKMNTKVRFSPNSSMDITDMLASVGAQYNSPDLEIEVRAPGDLEFILGGILSITISVKNGILDYLLSLPSDYKYNTEGLMGIWNDVQSDDLTPSNTFVPLPLNSSVRTIHYSFGLTWKVGVADAFFFYEGGLTTAEYTNDSYVPDFPDEITYSAEAMALCGDNMACLFDFSQTGNEDIADTSSAQNSEFFVMQSDLANFPPAISLSPGATSAILLTPGVPYVFDVMVTDEEAGVTLDVYSGAFWVKTLTSDQPLTKTYSVSVRTDDAGPFSLTLQATDVNGANTTLNFDITVCACANGVCRENMYSLQIPSLKFKLQACLCDMGWGGDLCDQDMDGCYLQSCYPGVSCTDLPPPSIYGTCGSCPLGTEGDGQVCVDVNECFDEGGLSHDCTSFGQTCVNTPGSYTCECLDGYIEQGSSCEDINECLLNPCEQLCININGDYSCACFPGWSYNNALDMCEPDTACAAPCGSGTCVVIGGIEQCFCESGYFFDASTCVDIDECTAGLHMCQDICTNIPKSYTCSCGDGYRIGLDSVSCNDINECEDIFSTPCGVNETCMNTIGSRKCLVSAASLNNPFILVLLIALLLLFLFTAV